MAITITDGKKSTKGKGTRKVDKRDGAAAARSEPAPVSSTTGAGHHQQLTDDEHASMSSMPEDALERVVGFLPAPAYGAFSQVSHTCHAVALTAVTVAVRVEVVRRLSSGRRTDNALCSRCPDLALPRGISRLEAHAFAKCDALRSVTLGAGLTAIHSHAFRGCSQLLSIVLPPGLTSIGSSAFADCSSLAFIDLPASLASIGRSAFAACTALQSVELPDGLTSLPDCTFQNCTGLEVVRLPRSLACIGDCAFYSTALAALHAPADSALVSIGALAFYGCSDLISVELPPLTSIGEDAFRGCNSLHEGAREQIMRLSSG